MPTADEFRTELYRMKHEAFKQDCEYVDIEAGELHRRQILMVVVDLYVR